MNLSLIQFSRPTSRIKWSNDEKNQRFEDHLRPSPQGAEEEEDGDGPRNVGFFAIQPRDAAGSPRRFYYT
jgi:hypothetical protein